MAELKLPFGNAATAVGRVIHGGDAAAEFERSARSPISSWAAIVIHGGDAVAELKHHFPTDAFCLVHKVIHGGDAVAELKPASCLFALYRLKLVIHGGDAVAELKRVSVAGPLYPLRGRHPRRRRCGRIEAPALRQCSVVCPRAVIHGGDAVAELKLRPS